MKETTILVNIDGQDVRVVIAGLHVPDNAIEVDTRDPGAPWHPVNSAHVAVEHDG